MQKIFHNAKILTYDEQNLIAEAFLVNDESIVIVGSNDEILSMKSDDTAVFDMGGKTIIPSFFDTNSSVYGMIEEKLKTTNRQDFLEDNEEVDYDYAKFINYEIYKNEFLLIQEKFIENGITTIFEVGVRSKEFTFWKKMAEDNALKIDIIGFVTFVTDKDVMDNNCKSYRKYKNHFRLGGYYLQIDDELFKKKAWLSKDYKREKDYLGYSYVVDEQLSCIIKMALDEKKQLYVETNGDNALFQFIRCFEENVKDKSEEELFKPIAKNCNFISKKQLISIKKLGISPSFQISDLKKYGDYYKKILGILRSKRVQPIALMKDNGIKFLLHSEKLEIPNIFELALIASTRENEKQKIIGKKHIISFDDALSSLIKHSAFFAFDQGFKGSIENGKKANFIVLNNSLEEIAEKKILNPISSVFMEGNEIYKKR